MSDVKHFLDLDGLTKYHNLSKNKFVSKETGKGLSTNDYTTEEKNKLAGIATGATAVTESTVSGWGFAKESKIISIEEKLGIAEPDANGHEYVDLGLPSGTLWATMNVGATSETDYGNYYMYGMGAKTYDSSDTPYQGMEGPLPKEYDTAAQVWGGDWRMPTEEQFLELMDNTTYQWVENYNNSGINGGLVTGSNGNTIFLPAASSYYGG